MATKRDNAQIKVSNYLVPATGGTAAVKIAYAGEKTQADPFVVNWTTYSLNGEPFQPSGFYAANFGLGPIFLKISGNDLIFEIPAGAEMGRMYPAPFDHSVSIYGSGDGQIVFVNSPVIPYGPDAGGGSGGAVTIADGADLAEGNTADPFLTDPGDAASVVSILKGIMAFEIEWDSAGNPVPFDFDSLAVTLNYAGDNVTSEVRTNGVNTWTRTYTYTGSNLTGISKWVRT